MVDPLFGKTSAAFDEGGAKGLLLNNLSIYGDCKIVFDSNDAIYSTTTTTTTDITSEKDNNDGDDEEKIESTPSLSNLNSKINITPWKHLFEPGSNNSLEICPTYCGFSDWSVKSKDGLSFNLSSLLRKNQDEGKQQQPPHPQNNQQENDNFLNHSGDDFEIEQSNQPQAQNEEIDLNKLGNNLDDGDMGIHFGGGDDDFGDGIGMGYEEDDDDNHNNINNDHNIMGILDANQDWEQLNLIEPNQNQNWTGPEHWKFSKSLNGEENIDDGEDSESDKTKKKKKVTRKKTFLLDFDSAPPPESMFEPGKGSTLTAASLKKASETSTILPPDIHYDIKMLSRLFNKPKCSIPPMSKREEVLRFLNPKSNRNNGDDEEKDDDDDDDNGNQDYDFPNSQILQDDFNPNENMNGGRRGINDDEDGYAGIGGWDDDDDRPINQNNVTNNNNNDDGVTKNNAGGFIFGLNGGVLIDEPRKVNKIDINYARVSKKIDVKSLKTSVWSIIDSDNNNQTNINTTNKKDSEIETDERSFGSLIDDLKEEQNQLRLNNKPTAGEISIPLAFICVLHLANEKNLTLNQDNINNFIISK